MSTSRRPLPAGLTTKTMNHNIEKLAIAHAKARYELMVAVREWRKAEDRAKETYKIDDFAVAADLDKDCSIAARESNRTEIEFYQAMDAEEEAKHSDRSESSLHDSEVDAAQDASESNK